MKSLNIAYNPRIDQLHWLAATIVFFFIFIWNARAWVLATISYGVIEEPFLRMRRGYGVPAPQDVAQGKIAA